MTARGRTILIGIAVLVTVQALAVTIYWVKRGQPDEPFIGETLSRRPAPELAFESHDGRRRSLDQLRGKPVLVHFWATWCEPCRVELPGLLAAAEAGAIELIAVSIDDEWPEIRTFFDDRVPDAIVRPVGADAHRRFGVSTLPDTYLVDPAGDLVERFAGARDWTTDRARDHLANALVSDR